MCDERHNVLCVLGKKVCQQITLFFCIISGRTWNWCESWMKELLKGGRVVILATHTTCWETSSRQYITMRRWATWGVIVFRAGWVHGDDNPLIYWYILFILELNCFIRVHSGTVGWGYVLQARRSLVWFPLGSLWFPWLNPSGHSMAPGSIQPLNEHQGYLLECKGSRCIGLRD